MTAVMVSVEGVLGQESRLSGFQPQPEAIRFLAAIKSQYKVLLSSVNPKKENLEHWLLLNGLTPELFYEELYVRTSKQIGMDEDEVHHEQIVSLRARGYGLTLVVSASPDLVADAVSMGIQGLLWASPTYLRPDMQPGGARRPRAWSVIEDEVERQAVLKNTDRRRVMPEEVR